MRGSPFGLVGQKYSVSNHCESIKSCCLTCLRCVSRVNIGCGPAEERLLLTGLHAVADIYCENCHTTLGWKYVSASPCKLNADFLIVVPVSCSAIWGQCDFSLMQCVVTPVVTFF